MLCVAGAGPIDTLWFYVDMTSGTQIIDPLPPGRDNFNGMPHASNFTGFEFTIDNFCAYLQPQVWASLWRAAILAVGWRLLPIP
jgi:hypothetical protein